MHTEPPLLQQVVDALFAVARHAQKKASWIPALGPRLADKHAVAFSDEQLNAGKYLPTQQSVCRIFESEQDEFDHFSHLHTIPHPLVTGLSCGTQCSSNGSHGFGHFYRCTTANLQCFRGNRRQGIGITADGQTGRGQCNGVRDHLRCTSRNWRRGSGPLKVE